MPTMIDLPSSFIVSASKTCISGNIEETIIASKGIKIKLNTINPIYSFGKNDFFEKYK